MERNLQRDERTLSQTQLGLAGGLAWLWRQQSRHPLQLRAERPPRME